MQALLVQMRCATCGRSLEDEALYCGLCGNRSRRRRESRVGSILGERYRIDGKIAEGGFGVVYRAMHLPTRTPVALKILHADLAGDPRIAERFRRESSVLARLRDPHTVVTYERGEFRDGTAFLAMELLHGQTLLERFRTAGPLPWRQVLEMVRDACRSLGEAHALGIVHRDLKPANLMITDQGQLKVLDFGVARLAPERAAHENRSITMVGQVVGTLDYMAPEQLAGVPCTPASDVYALGVIAYEMIVGHRPFPDANHAASLMAALLTQTPPAPSEVVGVPREVDTLLARCLDCDPDRRLRDGTELGIALDEIMAGPHEARDARVYPTAVPSPFRRAAVYFLGAALAGVGAAIAWILVH